MVGTLGLARGQGHIVARAAYGFAAAAFEQAYLPTVKSQAHAFATPDRCLHIDLGAQHAAMHGLQRHDLAHAQVFAA